MKKCPDCGEIKPLTEFYKVSTYCKSCVKIRNKEYRLNNPDKVRENQRKYAISDKGKEKAKERRQKNIEHYREKVNSWRKNHKEYFRKKENSYTAELADKYVRRQLRESGIPNPTAEQIEQRRERIRELRAKQAVRGKLNPCRQCLYCGIFFKFKPGGRNQNGGKYCSPFCQGLSFRKPKPDDYPRSAISINTCLWCGKMFTSRGTSCTYCSKDCRNERAKKVSQERRIELSKSAPPRYTKCRYCGKEFVRYYGDERAIFCSESCYKANKRYNKRVARGIRRARKRTGNYEPVDPYKVFERDKYVCQICGCQTSIVFRGSWLPYAPELDHIIPLSRGGNHSYQNTQCTCRACNHLKGNKVYAKSERTQIRHQEVLLELWPAN